MAEDKEKVMQEELEAEETKAEETKTEESAEAKETEAKESEAKETAENSDAQDGEAQTEESGSEQSEETADASENSEADSEKYMRLLAEFQNFKKRAAKEKTDIHAYANEKLMSELLPVLDNFERALETKTEEVEGYAKGMELIFQQMKTALDNHGLKEIAALGEDFDPNKHNAVMTEESEEYESGKVSKVLQKGYELNGRVVRPAMVAVTK